MSEEPSKTFELVMCVRNSLGKDTGKRRSYASDSAYKIWEVWSKYVSSFTRKKKKLATPTADEAQSILKSIQYKKPERINDNSL